MGVPAFFRWLCLRNPAFVIDAIENDAIEELSNNPGIDNLYLDMNGIIHPCTNTQNPSVPTPLTQQDMFRNVFMYVDRLMSVVRPQKLLFLAIDGVAPRAKMNQQRSRRFRSAMESRENQLQKQALRQFWEEQGIVDPRIEQFVDNQFDKNTITPGTPFMDQLSSALKHYVFQRMNNDPLWKGIRVIFSDANIPGEGQHKILDYIRRQRTESHYDPNMRHCIYGADADLIMLGLSTHEVHFYIIRETIVSASDKRCTICNAEGHFFINCPTYTGQDKGDQNEGGAYNNTDNEAIKPKQRGEILVNFQFAKIFVVRDWLKFYFKDVEKLSFQFNLERIIDDFVFMCFFVGNDFIPHIPTLNIREGGIDGLLYIYKRLLPTNGGYLTENGQLNLKRVNNFIQQLAFAEEKMVQETQKQEQRNRFYEQKRKDQDKNQEQEEQQMNIQLPELIKRDTSLSQLDEEKEIETDDNFIKFQVELQKREAAQMLPVPVETPFRKTMGYKQKYYLDQFDIQPRDYPELACKLKKYYTEALCWNFAYYYQGCISWGWFYPFHYAPFPTDLIDINFQFMNFDQGIPFSPFLQLLAVLPPASFEAVPQALHPLMLQQDSEIADFYPENFHIDVRGKRYAWMGETLVPFIDEQRLIKAYQQHEDKLNQQEKFRNRYGKQLLFVHSDSIIIENLEKNQPGNFFENVPLTWNNDQLAGFISSLTSEYVMFGVGEQIIGKSILKDVQENKVVSFIYDFPIKRPHITEVLPGTEMPEAVIDEFYMDHSNKQSYNGERIIQLLQRTLLGAVNYNNREHFRGSTRENLNNYSNQSNQGHQPTHNFTSGHKRNYNDVRSQHQGYDNNNNNNNYNNSNYNPSYGGHHNRNHSENQSNSGYHNQKRFQYNK